MRPSPAAGACPYMASVWSDGRIRERKPPGTVWLRPWYLYRDEGQIPIWERWWGDIHEQVLPTGVASVTL